jgi:hypothetical protein
MEIQAEDRPMRAFSRPFFFLTRNWKRPGECSFLSFCINWCSFSHTSHTHHANFERVNSELSRPKHAYCQKPLSVRKTFLLPNAVDVLFELQSDAISWSVLDFHKHLCARTNYSMGRPKPSQEVLDFALAFACAVTTQSASICDFVARSGNFSLYALLGRLAPKVRT